MLTYLLECKICKLFYLLINLIDQVKVLLQLLACFTCSCCCMPNCEILNTSCRCGRFQKKRILAHLMNQSKIILCKCSNQDFNSFVKHYKTTLRRAAWSIDTRFFAAPRRAAHRGTAIFTYQMI